MLGPVLGLPTCDVRLASMRACTVLAICSALNLAEPDSTGGGGGEGDGGRGKGDEEQVLITSKAFSSTLCSGVPSYM